MPKKPAKRKSSKPDVLTISIHGRGIDIDAMITDGPGLRTVIDSLAKQATPQPTEAEQRAIDFDAVTRVIRNADAATLQGLADLVLSVVEARRKAEPAEQPMPA